MAFHVESMSIHHLQMAVIRISDRITFMSNIVKMMMFVF